jgi:hypothetical protein
LVYRRSRSVFDFTLTGVVICSFTLVKVDEWLLSRLYITIGRILGVFAEGDVGVLFSLYSGSLSERTANWLDEQKEVEASLDVGCWPRFCFGV